MNVSSPTHDSRTSLVRITLLLSLALLGAGCVSTPTSSGGSSASPKSSPMYNTSYSKEDNVAFVKQGTKFKSEKASRRTRDMANWVNRSRDNRNLPYIILDKVNAKVYAFEGNGQLIDAAPVLLGLAKGDYSEPGIGNKPLSQIRASQRTTPAGRFLAQSGKNAKGKTVLWVDYNDALSLHEVVRGVPRDRRAQRLASITSSDNRISYGCINATKPFFRNVIKKKFVGTRSVVYIMPETKSFK